MRRIAAHFLLTPEGLLPRRVVSVSEAGTIVDISEAGPDNPLDREAGVEFYSGILIPGFVNAHCHLELSHLRGAIPEAGGFAAFVEGMKAAPREDTAGAAEFWDSRMWSDGVAAVGDVCNGDSTFDLKRCSKIHYHSFVEIFGAGADPQRATALKDRARAMGLAASVTPHSLYSLSSADFTAAVGTGGNTPLSIHFMESEFEVPSPAERLVALVPADRDVMLVHNTVVTQRDIDTVMGHFTSRVTWVMCPGSNRYISGLVPPVELLRRNRLDIAVGTDSLASNEELSMVHELALLSRSGDIPLHEMLLWATAGGARALGTDNRLGTIEKGRSPGLVLLSGVDMEKMKLRASATSRRIV